jgi:hypothetical protein
MRTYRRRIIVGAVIAAMVLVGIACGLWFAPIGSGEYKTSPDGRYTAEVSNETCGTWLHGRMQYVRVDVTESSSGRALFGLDYFPAKGVVVPDYEDREQKYIQWQPDSSAVAIPIDSGKSIVLPVR